MAEIETPEKGQVFGNRSKPHLSDICFKKPAEIKPRPRTVMAAPWRA